MKTADPTHQHTSRRDFLKNSALAAGVFPLSALSTNLLAGDGGDSGGAAATPGVFPENLAAALPLEGEWDVAIAGGGPAGAALAAKTGAAPRKLSPQKLRETLAAQGILL
ncbi:MAG: twin-arginine translocation signal domain-containing protein [Opitutaceae bacterium]|nr:twin-arginine translocation signal domain-containing protein [Opitutaceae bacterium]